MNELIKLLDDYELDIFDASTFESNTGQKISEWMNPLRSLIRNELIIILEKGKYCRHNFNDELVIGSFLANNGAISYWSALSYHGLTSQIPNTVFVQSSKRKAKKSIRGVRYSFIKIEESEFLGIEKKGFGNHTYLITDIEKTIIDCIDKPQFCGDYIELIRTIANWKPDEQKLIKYCQHLKNGAAVKRLGYLLELFNIPNCEKFKAFALANLVKGYALLDPKSEISGKYMNKWGIRLNIPEEQLKSMAEEGH